MWELERIRTRAQECMGIFSAYRRDVSRCTPVYAEPHVEDRTIVIISSEDSLLPFARKVTDAIAARLQESISADLNIRTEFMEFSRTPEGPDEDAIAQQLKQKYAHDKVDLIFAFGPQSLSLFVHKKGELFPGTPVIFAGIRTGNPMLNEMASNWGAVTADYNVVSTVKLAEALQPDLKRLVVVTGASTFDKTWRARALEDLRMSGTSLEIVDLAGLPLPDLLDQLAHLDRDFAVLYLTIWIDGAGHKYDPTSLTTASPIFPRRRFTASTRSASAGASLAAMSQSSRNRGWPRPRWRLASSRTDVPTPSTSWRCRPSIGSIGAPWTAGT